MSVKTASEWRGMGESSRLGHLLLFAILATASCAASVAEPLTKGWTTTDGGRGGAIVRVTNLNPDGPGSFKAAVERKGPRIVVFEVGGVIDLGLSTLTISEPYLTIAGQTAPSPGITLIRGGVDIKSHNIIIQHIRVRTGASGSAKRSGWEADAMSTVGARNVIVDHCSMTWGLDENLSASGPRFTGKGVEDWRNGTSHNITFSYNLLAESLANSSHPKGEHSKGTLIHDNATGILIYRNVYAHNYERNPLLKGGVQAAVVNNLIFNPGAQAIHYNLMDLEWTGKAPCRANSARSATSCEPAFRPVTTLPSCRSAASATSTIMATTISLSDDSASRCRCSAATRRARPEIVEAAIRLAERVAVLPANEVETHVFASPAPGRGIATHMNSRDLRRCRRPRQDHRRREGSRRLSAADADPGGLRGNRMAA